MNNHKFKEILIHARQLPLFGWHGYHCVNSVQELNRLSFLYEDIYEVQVNEITHSTQAHIHTSCMTSLILDKGYTWHLQQEGATSSLEMFAAPGSVIRMGPKDTHWIPPQQDLSLSICVFEHQTDWHLDYPALSPTDMNRLYDLFCRKFDDLMLVEVFCPTPNFLVNFHD